MKVILASSFILATVSAIPFYLVSLNASSPGKTAIELPQDGSIVSNGFYRSKPQP